MLLPEKLMIALVLSGGPLAVGYGSYEIFKPKIVMDTLSSTDMPLDYEIKDDELWKTLVTKYKESSNNPKISGLTMENTSDTDHKEGIKKLKEECKKILNTKLKGLTNEDLINKQNDARRWCMRNSQLTNK